MKNNKKKNNVKKKQELVWPVRKSAEYYNIGEGPTLFDEVQETPELIGNSDGISGDD